MNPKLFAAIQSKDYRHANEQFAQVMGQKMAVRLAEERKSLTEDFVVERVISDEPLPLLTHKSVQKIFDATGSVRETEMLAGCTNLVVSGNQVISFVGDLTEETKVERDDDDEFTKRFYMSSKEKKDADKKTAGSRDAKTEQVIVRGKGLLVEGPKYAYSITLTADEYKSAVVMSDRGYLGEIVTHATALDWSDDESTVTLQFRESDAWKVNETIEADPHAVWALTTPSTSLGKKFQKFVNSIV